MCLLFILLRENIFLASTLPFNLLKFLKDRVNMEFNETVLRRYKMNRLNIAIVCLTTLAICAAGSWAQGVPQQEPQDFPSLVLYPVPSNPTPYSGPEPPSYTICPAPPEPNPGGGGVDGYGWRAGWRTPCSGPEPPSYTICPAPPEPNPGGGGVDGGRLRAYWKSVLKTFQPSK